ncbi:hypothetical protein [Pseudomaricurvus sp.]|uniref:hypothetical protein n=1 Tax=Pseudomaricurvus sp. TaxID=2004510 RepID=UPI003F6C8A9F
MSELSNTKNHMESFAKAFVESSRKERWVGFLGHHKSKNYKRSAELFNHLDERFIVRNDSLEGVADFQDLGVFYDFLDEPALITFQEACAIGNNKDAIFSIIPGKLAVYFFHEGWNYVCSK